MTPAPTVDGRDEEAWLAAARERAPGYVPEWDPEGDEVGGALVHLAAALGAGVSERLDRLPGKHRVAFLDALGFDRAPPEPARLPVVVDVAEGAPGNVVVPGGTRVVATGADGAERTFELPPAGGLEATPARLRRVVSVDPAVDGLYEHTAAVPGVGGPDSGDGGRAGPATGTLAHLARPFSGPNRQRHALYLGDDDLLRVGPGAVVDCVVETDVDPALLRDALRWEYHGTAPDDDAEPDGEPAVGWHPLRPVAATGQSRGEAPSREAGAVGRSAVEALATRLGVDPGATGEDEHDDRSTDANDEVATGDDGEETLADALAPYGYVPNPSLDPVSRRRLLATVAARLRDAGGTTTPRGLLPPRESREGVLAAVRGALSGVVDGRRVHRGPVGRVTLRFVVPGEPTAVAVGGVESLWLRARVRRDAPSGGLFGARVAGVTLRVGPGSAPGDADGGLAPDRLLANDVPLPADDAFRPLGTTPRALDAFYVASREAFTKPGDRVGLRLRPAPGATGAADESFGVADGAPSLSFEYFDGRGWARLPGVEDGTDALRRPGTVRFDVPTGLAPTTVAGHEGHWIRVRLTDGEYVRTRYEETADGWRTVAEGTAPRFGGVDLRYVRRATPAHVLAENNGSVSPRPDADRFVPFRPLPDATQTLYLGFDGPLTGGPLRLLASLESGGVPDGFVPAVRWERTAGAGADPDADGVDDRWTALDVEDGTEGLTERGLVTLALPSATVAVPRFGERCHWLRARVTRDEFLPTGEPLFARAAGGDAVGEGSSGRVVAGDGSGTGARLATAAPGGPPTPTAPVLAGLYPNAAWAYDRRTVAEEVLGGSDGSPGQSFAVASPPVLDATLSVDESAALPADERTALSASGDVEVEVETDADGTVRAAWVAWTRVSDLDGSSPRDRHYVLDAVAGRVRFGDGVNGSVPPRGRANVRLTYRTGGGAAGNVPRGAVVGLASAIPFVAGVSNPEPADGGVDEEAVDRVLTRAPRELRDRGRAVTAADVERVATAASRLVARARCLPGVGRAGEPAPGRVTVLVVPRTAGRVPVPSAELCARVRAALRERAPARLFDPADPRLVVRGPSLVEVSVETTVRAAGVESRSTLERRVRERLDAFCHPLSGGPGGEGWWFGELPSHSEVYAELEAVEGVDHVESLSVTYRGSEGDLTVTAGEPLPRVAADALVHAGHHDVTATGPPGGDAGPGGADGTGSGGPAGSGEGGARWG